MHYLCLSQSNIRKQGFQGKKKNILQYVGFDLLFIHETCTIIMVGIHCPQLYTYEIK